MKIKKLLAGVLTGAMVLGAMCTSAFADATAEVKYEGWSDDTGAVSGYTYTVENDVDSVNIAIQYADAVDDGSTFGYNDWCNNGIKVTLSDGTTAYYCFGGASATWDTSIAAKDSNDVLGGTANENGRGFVLTDGAGSFDIAVDQGATIDFYALGWDSYDGTQFTVTITEAAEDGDDSAEGSTTLPVVLAAVAALAVVATVSTKKFAER